MTKYGPRRTPIHKKYFLGLVLPIKTVNDLPVRYDANHFKNFLKDQTYSLFFVATYCDKLYQKLQLGL